MLKKLKFPFTKGQIITWFLATLLGVGVLFFQQMVTDMLTAEEPKKETAEEVAKDSQKEKDEEHFFKGKPKKEVKKETLQWSYEGITSESRWAEIDPAYEVCKHGRLQSPIDISHVKPLAYGTPLEFYYGPSKVRWVNDSRMIKGEITGNHFFMNRSHKYSLSHLEMHTPSEHTIQGRSYPAELQMYHEDRHGNKAVISMLIKIGNTNQHLKKLAEDVPKTAHIKSAFHNVNFGKLIPYARDYYKYLGSMTSPPCSEGVQWFVFKTPLYMSPKQLHAFEFATGANSRSVQAPYARDVILNRLLSH